MGTLLGAVVGYVFRGMSGSEGFRDMVDSARAVGSSREFESLVRSARSHASFVLRDVTSRLSEQADSIAEALSAEAPSADRAEPADWETWPPPGRSERPFPDEMSWPNS
jgi:hypothetical protein